MGESWLATIRERKTKSGEVRYHVIVRLKGYPPQTATFKRKTDAIDWVRQTEGAILEGRHFKNAEAKKLTFADLVDMYIERVVPVRHTHPIANKAIKRHLNWWKSQLGPFQLPDITPARIAMARDKLQASPANTSGTKPKTDENGAVKTKSPATVVRYMASLSVMLTVAVNEWEFLEQNPAQKVRRPREASGRVRFLSDSERRALLAACAKSSNPYLYTVVVIALSTGARYSEIMNLRWQDLDLERGIARLENTKNHERRALPLAHEALKRVQALAKISSCKPKAYLFARPDGKAPASIQTPWAKAVEEAGIENFRFHDLRHSAASYLAMNGATLAEIAEVLGHKTLQMVKRYAHLSEQHTAGVVERMNKAIFTEPANDNDESSSPNETEDEAARR